MNGNPLSMPNIGHFVALTGLALMAGCAAVEKPIFPELQSPRVWPAPPDTPRIRYVGELTGEASLNAAPHGWDAVRTVLAGERNQAAFSTPTAVAVAGEVVFVADGQMHCVHRLDLSQRKYLAVTTADGRPLAFPIDLVVADERLIVVDSQRPGLFEFDLSGNYLRSLSTSGLQRPGGIARDAESGNFWVTDTGAHACILYDRVGRELRRVGARGAGLGQFNFPTGLAWSPSIGLCVVDAMNFRVQELNHEGAPIRCFGRKGDAAGDFSLPRDLAIDTEGHIYVLDNQFENIQIFDAQGQLLMALGGEGAAAGEFNLPSGITIDARDRIWIADTYNRRVQVFQYLREQRDGA